MSPNTQNQTPIEPPRGIPSAILFGVMAAIVVPVLIFGFWWLSNIYVAASSPSSIGEGVGVAGVAWLVRLAGIVLGGSLWLFCLVHTIVRHRTELSYYMSLCIMPIALAAAVLFSIADARERDARLSINKPLCEQAKQLENAYVAYAPYDPIELEPHEKILLKGEGVPLDRYYELGEELATADTKVGDIQWGVGGVCMASDVNQEHVRDMDAIAGNLEEYNRLNGEVHLKLDQLPR